MELLEDAISVGYADNITLTMHYVLLCGSEIGAHTLDKAMYRQRFAQVRRRATVRVVSAFRMASEPAVPVVAGVILIGLMAKERQRKYKKKLEPGNIEILDERENTTMHADYKMYKKIFK